MDYKKVKTNINRLLAMQSGRKMARYQAVATMLHLSPRMVMYLSTGEKKANIHLAEAIERMVSGQ